MAIWIRDQGESPRLCDGCGSVLGDVLERTGGPLLAGGVCSFCAEKDWPAATWREADPTQLFLDRLLVALPEEGEGCRLHGEVRFSVKAVPEPRVQEPQAWRWSPEVARGLCPACGDLERLAVRLDRHVHRFASPRVLPPNEGWGGRWFLERGRDRHARRPPTGT